MRSILAILERIRALPRRTVVAAAVIAFVIAAALIGVLASPEELLGVLGLVAYVVAVLALSAAVTLAVVKISPSQSAKEQAREGS
jgi:hypothetical protein